MCNMSNVPKTVTIREDQDEWLEGKPSINLSGLVQEVIDREMEMRDQYGDVMDLDEPDNGSSPDSVSLSDERTI